jgi:hypothetical protein
MASRLKNARVEESNINGLRCAGKTGYDINR